MHPSLINETEGSCVTCGGDTDERKCPCVRATWRRLTEIQDHAVILSTAGLSPGRGRLTGLPGPRGYASRPPTSLDVLTALDYRSHTDGQGDDDDPDETTLSVLRSVHQIAAHVAQQRYEAALMGSVLPRPFTVAGLTNYLRVHTEWSVSQDWGRDYVDVVRTVHAQTCRQAGDAPPQPLGRCIEDGCAGMVWRHPGDEDRGRCSAVREHTYVGLQLARLRAAQEQGTG